MVDNKKKKVLVFGNPDLEIDSLPLRILPVLQKKLLGIEFIVQDPNEEWEIGGEEITILDTAIGIKNIEIFDNLSKFSKVPRVGMHDFDALTNLRFLQKLGKIKKIKIIALPSNLSKKETIVGLLEILS